MPSDPNPLQRRSLSPALALTLGTLTVGMLDLLDALVFFGFLGVPPIRIFQSIASGLLGPAAFNGGLSTAMLGGLLHFFIAGSIVTVYYLASRHLPRLTRHPLFYGTLYGLLVYAIMNLVVIPLSAAASSPPSLAVVCNGLFIHVVGVGLPSALFARAARPSSPRTLIP